MSSARDNNAEVYASGSFAQSYDVEEITIYTRPTNRTPVNPDDESSQANPRASRTPSQSGLLQRVSSRNLNVPEDNPTKSSLLDQLDIHTPPVYSTPKLFATIAGLAVFAASSAAVLVGLACYKFGNKLTPEPLLTKVHYVMQMCGFVAFIHSVVIYRLYGISFKYLRIMHVCSHLTALFTLLAGVAMRVHAKMKYPVYGATVAAGVNKYEPHLFTLHSFIATASLIMYMFQLVGSAYLFSMSMRKNIITFHREIGIFLMTGLASVVSAGIQQLFSRLQCMPAFSNDGEAYNNPAVTYLSLPRECKILNIAGVLVYVSVLLATVAVSRSGLEDVLELLMHHKKRTVLPAAIPSSMVNHGNSGA